jgi:hypothetical protein
VTDQATAAAPALVEVPDDLDQFNAWAMEQRWSDGLPLIPPTEARVAAMLKYSDRDRDEVVTRIPPRWAEASVEKIAVNAVMAGCEPQHLPIVIAAIITLSHPSVNLYGVLATTHPCTTMVMVNGPLAAQAGINAATGVFGPGFRANATIGRAVRLVLQNIGGAYPAVGDRSTLGGPAKFTFCFAENEAESPWQPYHMDRGFDREDSTITVVGAEAPQNIEDHISKGARELLGTFAWTIASLGSNNAYCRNSDFFVGFCPDHARTLADHHFGKRDVQEYLYNTARIPYGRWKGRALDGVNPRPRWFEALDDDMTIPMVDDPDDMHIVVVGGPGLHSCWIPTFGVCRSYTGLIARADGSPARNLTDFAR